LLVEVSAAGMASKLVHTELSIYIKYVMRWSAHTEQTWMVCWIEPSIIICTMGICLLTKRHKA
jgi:hypothetical protein